MHILTFLGTSRYEETEYIKGRKENRFFLIALLDALINRCYPFTGSMDLSSIDITVFLTDNARKDNWEKSFNRKGEKKKGLSEELSEYISSIDNVTFSVEDVSIANGNNEAEIWENFEVIYNSINENDSILFDITNGFRALPFITAAIINYATTMKRCSLSGVYYGVYPAVEDNSITDLTSFYEMIGWTNAASDFIKYGTAKPLNDMFCAHVHNPENNNIEANIKWNGVKNVVTAMYDMSKDISTCRGAYMGTKEPSIQNKYNDLLRRSDKLKRSSVIDEKLPLAELVNRILEEYKAEFDEYNSESNKYMFGIAVAKWCCKHELIQQGYTSIEETLISYLCDVVYSDEMKSSSNIHPELELDKRNTMSSILGILSRYMKSDCDTEFKDFFFDNYIMNARDGIDKEQVYSLYEKMLNDARLDIKRIAKIFNAVSYIRNDVNHFGMRKSAKDSKEIIDELANIITEFELCVRGSD